MPIPPFKILQAARRFAEKWARLPRSKKINRGLAAFVSLCILVGLKLLSSSLWGPLEVVAALAGAAFLWLAWRVKPHKTLTLGQRILVLALILVIICTSLFTYWYFHNEAHIRANNFRNELKTAGLPADLYDYQDQFDSLTIDQGTSNRTPLSDVDWLHSERLKEFSVRSPHLKSLNGVAPITTLDSLDLDLKNVPIESLRALSPLQQLRTLTLLNIGRAKKPVAPEIGAFKELRTLNLDFERSPLSKVPDLSALTELQDFTLDLKFSAITDLPDLSGLHNFHTVSVFLDGSKVSSIKPLTKIDQLPALVLSLDEPKLPLLNDLNHSDGPQSLTIELTTPTNVPFPHLDDIRRLTALSLRMPGPQGTNGKTDTVLTDSTPIPDITYLQQLQDLAISMKFSEASELPPIEQLSNLQALDLDLDGSNVLVLPDISTLHQLTRLTLNLSSTTIPELPDFALLATKAANLSDLTLILAYSRIHSLRGIEHLPNLKTLILDITGAEIQDLESIAKATSLTKLVLALNWSQVSKLPDLSPLKNVTNLDLYLNGWQREEKLPDASRLPPVKNLTLIMEKSEVKDFSLLEQMTKLEHLCLGFHGAKIHSLPNLRPLTKLTKVVADISDATVKVNQFENFPSLDELTIDNNVSSLDGLPKSLRKLHVIDQRSRLGSEAIPGCPLPASSFVVRR